MLPVADGSLVEITNRLTTTAAVPLGIVSVVVYFAQLPVTPAIVEDAYTCPLSLSRSTVSGPVLA